MSITLEAPVPPKATRDWVRQSSSINRTYEEASTFARITLRNLDGEGIFRAEDPHRIARKMEAVAARLLYAARHIRRLG